jgi:hypothetical protein
MGLEKILNPYVADSVAGFSMGFIQGMRYSKFDKYSDYYDSKQLRKKNNDRLMNSVFYGSLLPLFDFFVRKVSSAGVRYELIAGLASSAIGFESGKMIGSLIYKNNDKLDKAEEEQLTKYLNNMREATKKADILELSRNTLECHKLVMQLGNKKPNRKLRDNIMGQLADTMNYCVLYKRITTDLDSPVSKTIIVGLPKYPKAHALIINERSITDLSIQFDYYSMIKRDDLPIGQLNVKPHLSRNEIEWDSDIDKVINMAESYKKDNSVLIILGGREECSMKKEIEASTNFTIVYTDYLNAKQIKEKYSYNKRF